MHPNPGPRRKSKSFAEARIICLNVQSAKNAWKVLDDFSPEKTHVLCLQEIRMSDSEIEAFRKCACLRGFFSYFQPGITSKGRWNEDRVNGGVATLVSRQVSHKLLGSKCFEGGQFILTWIADTLLCNVYIRPHAHAEDIFEGLFQECIAHRDSKFLCLGDWNLTPEENDFLPSLDPLGGWCLHVCNEQSQAMPTRWDGTRCIDYGVTNLACQDVSVTLSPLKYGDHILLDLSCSLGPCPQVDGLHGPLKRVNHYEKPENVSDAVWMEAVSLSWKLLNFQKP